MAQFVWDKDRHAHTTVLSLVVVPMPHFSPTVFHLVSVQQSKKG
jgi:hypothetical protein